MTQADLVGTWEVRDQATVDICPAWYDGDDEGHRGGSGSPYTNKRVARVSYNTCDGRSVHGDTDLQGRLPKHSDWCSGHLRMVTRENYYYYYTTKLNFLRQTMNFSSFYDTDVGVSIQHYVLSAMHIASTETT